MVRVPRRAKPVWRRPRRDRDFHLGTGRAARCQRRLPDGVSVPRAGARGDRVGDQRRRPKRVGVPECPEGGARSGRTDGLGNDRVHRVQDQVLRSGRRLLRRP